MKHNWKAWLLMILIWGGLMFMLGYSALLLGVW